MSVVVEDNQNRHILICKGAVEEILALSTGVEIQGKVLADGQLPNTIQRQ